MSNDIDFLAQHAYRSGEDPIDYALSIVTVQIDAHRDVVTGRADDPRLYPFYGDDLDSGGLARRIVGQLLDAGWTPPVKPADDESETA